MSPIPIWSDQISDIPVGPLRVWVTENGVRRIDFCSEPSAALGQVLAGEALSPEPAPPHLEATTSQLREYMDRRRRTFDVPLDLSQVTRFQFRVYERLLLIPYGSVVTYGEVATEIGEEPRKARAVGRAIGANPIVIVVPCHRVVAADGRLTGFGGGTSRKAALLRLEGIYVDGTRPSSRVQPEIIRLPI